MTNLSHDDINHIADAIVNHPEFSGRLLGRVMSGYMNKIDVETEKQRVRNLLRAEVDQSLKIREWKSIADDRLNEAIRQKIASHEKNISDQIDQQVATSSWMQGNRVEREFETAVQHLARQKVNALVDGVQRKIEEKVQKVIQDAISKVDVKFNLGSIFNSRNDSDWDD